MTGIMPPKGVINSRLHTQKLPWLGNLQEVKTAQACGSNKDFLKGCRMRLSEKPSYRNDDMNCFTIELSALTSVYFINIFSKV